MRARFPAYDYADMVLAQYRLVTEGLGVKHLRLVIGNSMGGMNAWVWGVAHPGFMDALVPMASQPTAMSARKLDDAADAGGVDPHRPRVAAWRLHGAAAGGTAGERHVRHRDEWRHARVSGDGALGREGGPHGGGEAGGPGPPDANDFLFQWDASRNYDPSGRLEAIEAQVLAINSADDERNPPETGLMDRAMARIKHGRMLLIPASTETRGHGTTGNAGFYAKELGAFLAGLPGS